MSGDRAEGNRIRRGESHDAPAPSGGGAGGAGRKDKSKKGKKNKIGVAGTQGGMAGSSLRRRTTATTTAGITVTTEQQAFVDEGLAPDGGSLEDRIEYELIDATALDRYLPRVTPTARPPYNTVQTDSCCLLYLLRYEPIDATTLAARMFVYYHAGLVFATGYVLWCFYAAIAAHDGKWQLMHLSLCVDS